MKNSFLFILISLSISSFCLAQERAYLNLNNISTVFKNTGISDIDIYEQNSGFKFPKETGKTAYIPQD